MFLHILTHTFKYRVVHFSYCRSKETISKKFNNVLRTVMKVNTYSSNNFSLSRSKYCNRKGDVSTNVLGACDPNLRFIYVLLGWKGSVGESHLLLNALYYQNKLEIPTCNIFCK
uniref:DDE Tnp4 domain-containing protein n=1 Tax=Cajanus cajan TaxID=3821 RepID=A0A151RE87_CAJCA|nr:hypothetical protein KK1_037723 [Cajanus cajan]